MDGDIYCVAEGFAWEGGDVGTETVVTASISAMRSLLMIETSRSAPGEVHAWERASERASKRWLASVRGGEAS